jgi:hypothetical protein
MHKRKDDIRRRLTINEVPKPPDDLVHMIKRDIPKHFTSRTSKEVEKNARPTIPLWNIWGFSWQLAAGILVMVGLTWIVFEAWRTEMTRPAQVAEADTHAPTVEEFEARVTGEPSAAVEAAPEEVAGDAEPRKARMSAPPPAAPSAGRDFAPDVRRDAAETLDVQPQGQAAKTAPSPMADSRGTRDEAPPVVATAVPGAASAPTSTRAAPSSMGLEAGSAAVAEAPAAKARTAPRELVVNGLVEERIVRVELQLDAAGRVIHAKVIDEVNDATRDAVSVGAKEWTFEVVTAGTRAKDLTRTIDVQLRREK